MVASGTYLFQPNVGDFVLDAFERCRIYAPSLETKHMVSARRSTNFVQNRMALRGVNLWEVDTFPTLINLVQGIQTYTLTSDVVGVLDTYIRTQPGNNSANQIGSLIGNPIPTGSTVTTTGGSNLVTVFAPANGFTQGEYVSILGPMTVGGLTLNGVYTVKAIVDANHFTMNVGLPATFTAIGVVPATGSNPNPPSLIGSPIPINSTITTAGGSNLVTVFAPNSGFAKGQFVNLNIPLVVGGLTLGGVYTISSIVDANHFTMNVTFFATSDSTVQVGALVGVDIIQMPISRNDFAALPQKSLQGRPTSFWFQKNIIPQIDVWPVPDANGPYQLQTYLLHQVQDANPAGAQTPQIPYRAFYAFCAMLAYDLGLKFADLERFPQLLNMLKQEAMEAWMEFANDDIEQVSMYIVPDFGSD